MANWCSRVTPVVLDFDGEPAEAYADPDRSDWIYIRFNGTTYCNWAKKEGGFGLLNETTLRISDPGRSYRKHYSTEGSESSESDDDREDSSSQVVVTSSKVRRDAEAPQLTREDLEAVVSYLPALRDAVDLRKNDRAAKQHEYSPAFSSAVRQIVNEFHTRRFMYAFDYMSWMDEAERLMGDRDALATADLETLRKLLVVHWRTDYWDNDHNHWEFIATTGHLTDVLERMQELANQMEPSAKPPKSKFVWDDEDAEGMDIRLPDDTEAANEWPTVEELMAGFDRIHDKITPQQMTMLRVNYYSGGRSATMRELATASGYGDYKIANVQYGSLAKRLYKAIGYPKPKSVNSDGSYWVLGLGEFIDRSDFGLEMQCVMRPEVAEALERLGIVESAELDAPNSVYAWEVDDLIEKLPAPDEEINDFIVYHNPGAMGPLEPSDDFGVVTNRGLGSAKVGDRVWLITGEGTPRKYYLAKWFYIDEFTSGEDNGFKHCITGVEGENFDPFVEIEQGEWFAQLKQDQGNFAFGFSRINTPGAVGALKKLSGFHHAFHLVPAGKLDRLDTGMANKIENIVRRLREVEHCIDQVSDSQLDEAIAGLLDAFDAADLYLEDDPGTWLTYACVYADKLWAFPTGDLLALQTVLSRYVVVSGYFVDCPREEEVMQYWREVAKNGELTTLRRGFEDYLQFHKERDAVAEPGASEI